MLDLGGKSKFFARFSGGIVSRAIFIFPYPKLTDIFVSSPLA